MRRLTPRRFAGIAAIIAVSLAVFAPAGAAAPVGGAAPASTAQGDVTTTTAISVQADAQHSIIPVPQADGAYDVQPGEPGSSEQYLVFVLIIGGLAAITFLVSRESKKKREALGLSKADPTTLYEDV